MVNQQKLLTGKPSHVLLIKKMIDSDFLSKLRKKYQPCTLLLMVQLDQRCPGWWQNLTELASELGMDIYTLRRNLQRLDKYGLVARYSAHGIGSGTYVWWVKKNEDDKPPAPPAWKLRNIENGSVKVIQVGQIYNWARANGMKPDTVHSFLRGYIKLLNNRWKLVSNPMDYFSAADSDCQP
jgi:hypothetical protein